jgi:hypothetical protein
MSQPPVRQRSAGNRLRPCFPPLLTLNRACVPPRSSVPQVNAYPYSTRVEQLPQILGANIMPKEIKNKREDKKKATLTPKEKKAAKRSKKEAKRV